MGVGVRACIHARSVQLCWGGVEGGAEEGALAFSIAAHFPDWEWEITGPNSPAPAARLMALQPAYPTKHTHPPGACAPGLRHGTGSSAHPKTAYRHPRRGGMSPLTPRPPPTCSRGKALDKREGTKHQPGPGAQRKARHGQLLLPPQELLALLWADGGTHRTLPRHARPPRRPGARALLQAVGAAVPDACRHGASSAAGLGMR